MTIIDHVVLDFDGTCTLVHDVEVAYLAAYFELLRAELLPGLDEAKWDAQLAALRAASPQVGWMLGGAAPSAPASADPYMLAGEAATRLLPRDRVPLGTLHQRAYDQAQAPFRAEVAGVIRELVALGVTVTFVSNSRSVKIAHRVADLLASDPAVGPRVAILGDAAKFTICELPLETKIAEPLRQAFAALPAGAIEPATGRPIYLRRGRYFEALCKVWGDDATAVRRTIVCGDVWELDLAMPHALGCQVHAIRRRGRHATYAYEEQLAQEHGASSDDLVPLLDRVRATRAASTASR